MLIYYLFLFKDALAQYAFHALYVDFIANDFQINEGHLNSCGHLYLQMLLYRKNFEHLN